MRTLHDLPLGTFISVYSGEIFTSEQADERGKLIGDEYQADLDFFEVNWYSKTKMILFDFLKNINNDSDEEKSGGDSDDDENNLSSESSK